MPPIVVVDIRFQLHYWIEHVSGQGAVVTAPAIAAYQFVRGEK
ncbi:hypothetical protein [Rhodanobacter caeni]|jgi:hypothetical protein